MMAMRSVFGAFFCLSCLLVSLPVAFADSASDASLTSQLVGQWTETRVFENEVHQHSIDLKPDGTFVVKGSQKYPDRTVKFSWQGAWHVNGGFFIYKTKLTSHPELFPIGEVLRDEIVSVSDTQWEMIEGSTGEKSRAKRIK